MGGFLPTFRNNLSALSSKVMLDLMFAIPKCYDIYRIYNRSVYNTTILVIYIK